MKIEINVSESKELISPRDLQIIRRCANVLRQYDCEVDILFSNEDKTTKSIQNTYLKGKVALSPTQ